MGVDPTTVEVQESLSHTNKDVKPRYFTRYGQLLVRSLRLSALEVPLSRWTGVSQSDVVLLQSRVAVLIRAITHVIPLGVELLLLVFTAKGVFFLDYSPQSNTPIQFAAKAVEILVQMSLSAIFLHLVHWTLLGSDSLPLGTLFGPLQTTFISYLWSMEFWAAMTASWLTNRRKLVVFCLTVLTVLLAALVGPSTAILMIPRPMEHVADKFQGFLDDESIVYPLNLTLADIENSSLGDGASFNDTLIELSTQYSLSQRKRETFPIVNFAGSRSMYISGNVPEGQLPTYATVPSVTTRSLVVSNTMSKSTLVMTAKQPVVQMHCNQNNVSQYDGSTENHFLSFGEQYRPLNNLYTLTDFVSHVQRYSDDNSLTETEYLTVGDSDKLDGHSALLMYSIGSVGNQSNQSDSYSMVYGCVVDAVWTDVLMNYTDQDGLRISDVAVVFHDQDQWRKSQPRIHLEDDLFQDITTYCMSSFGAEPLLIERFLPLCVALRLSNYQPGVDGSVYPTDAQFVALHQYLERLGLETDNDHLVFSLSTTAYTDPATLTRIELDVMLAGYGYNLDTVTVKLAFTVLVLYCIATTAFLVLLLVTGKTTSSWDTISELFLLALNSNPPAHLQAGSGEGEGKLSTFTTLQEPINIRSGEDGSVEVVFANDERTRTSGYSLLTPNQVYQRL